jgi:hypothetical protein
MLLRPLYCYGCRSPIMRDDCDIPQCRTCGEAFCSETCREDHQVMHKPSAPAAVAPATSPSAGRAVPTAEATQAPPQAAGEASAATFPIGDVQKYPPSFDRPPAGYAGSDVRRALWEGAEAERTVAGLRAYVEIQQPLLDELKARAPAEHAALGAAINARLRELKGAA